MNSFCSYKFNHKNFFAVGFTNRSATTSFSAVKSINPYIPAETVQRSIQNQGTYFYRVKPQEFSSFSWFYFHRYSENFADKIIQQVRLRSSEALCSAFESFTLSFGDFLVCIASILFYWFLSFLTVFVCFASFSSCLKEFRKQLSGHLARSPQTRKIAVPLSVFVKGSLIYTLGT